MFIRVNDFSLVGMGDAITKETFIWASKHPKIIRASETICRLMDDIVGHKASLSTSLLKNKIYFVVSLLQFIRALSFYMGAD